MIRTPQMLLIGSAGRNSGKTVLACELIARFGSRTRLVGAKVTTIHQREGGCPRGGEGCGVCSSFEGSYCLSEETEEDGAKDTQRLLASGAERVYWLRVLYGELEAGARALLDAVGPQSMVICESNSLRTVIEPGVFFMARRLGESDVKESAANVMAHADRIVWSDGASFDLDQDTIQIDRSAWVLSSTAPDALTGRTGACTL